MPTTPKIELKIMMNGTMVKRVCMTAQQNPTAMIRISSPPNPRENRSSRT